MKKKIVLFFSVICSILCLVGCMENKADHVEIYNKSTTIFDNTFINIKDGYFYTNHEKFTVDENTIGLTIYFTNSKKDEWD